MASRVPGCREEEALQIQAKLKRLLQTSFMYLGLQELREVPMAIMSTLEQVPPVFLKQVGQSFAYK